MSSESQKLEARNELVSANVSSHICLLQLLRERSRHQCCDVGTAGPRKLLGEVVFLQITYRCSHHIKVNIALID